MFIMVGCNSYNMNERLWGVAVFAIVILVVFTVISFSSSYAAQPSGGSLSFAAGGTRPGFINFATFFGRPFAKPGAHNKLVFGFSPSAPSPGANICPMACYLFSVGGSPGSGPSAVNCNVNQSEIYKPYARCAGYQTDYGQGNATSCVCHPDPTQPEACPSSCTSQATCIVDISVVGRANIPCDGIANGTNNQNCKCAYVNGNWTLGSRYGIN